MDSGATLNQAVESATCLTQQRGSLREADCWIFDLDNTLYSASIDLFSQIADRMRSYIATYLRIDEAKAHTLQKQYFRQFGTSLRGLMDVHAMDPAPFLAHVHDIDISVLEPAPDLDKALAALTGRKLIFTNASTRHAERVLRRLGIEQHFTAIFDIHAADFRPKPEPQIYEKFVKLHAVDPMRAVMVEDMARNLKPAADLGMTTVWVRCGSELGAHGAEDGHIDHTVDDLVDWLHGVTAGHV